MLMTLVKVAGVVTPEMSVVKLSWRIVSQLVPSRLRARDSL